MHAIEAESFNSYGMGVSSLRGCLEHRTETRMYTMVDVKMTGAVRTRAPPVGPPLHTFVDDADGRLQPGTIA
jgi:hypothetical protein